MAVGKVVHGDDMLYRFFLDLSEAEPERFKTITQIFAQSMAIWLPIEIYQRNPVLLPWVVRDPKCRGNRKNGIPDQWGAPNSAGYLRDDNSLVKALPRSLTVRGPSGSRLDGARMGTEFVASHIWRSVGADARSSNQIPLLNTFVPNLVWLPSQIAKLSDLEGGIVQKTLKAMSYKIYSGARVQSHLQPLVDEAWSQLARPEPSVEVDVDLEKLNWFVNTERFERTRADRISSVVNALEDLAAGKSLSRKVITTRYTDGLPHVEAQRRDELLRFLLRFRNPVSS